MDLKIEYPVRFNEQHEIVDKWNNIVIPSITWSRDFNHLDRQKGVGELIVKLMNDHGVLMKTVPEDNEATGSYDANRNGKVEGAETKIRNPWGRKGRPA